jgi:hypothetical protein
MRQNKYEYDAFISHAVEDKIPIANELCAKLEQAGLKIWYSGKELGVGDSIEKTIEKGLNRSRYGIVIFSPTYLAKNWTIREFYTLLAKEIKEQKVILPVLYNITLDELKNKDLLMADRFAVNSDRGMDFVVERLVREIRKTKSPEPKVEWFSRIWFILILSLLTNVALLVKGFVSPGSPELLQLHSSMSNNESIHDSGASLIGHMQGLMQQMSKCSCSHQVQQTPPHFRKSAIRGESGNMQQFAIGSDNAAQNKTAERNGPGKMTMAVIFQMEMPQPDQKDIRNDMDEILEVVDADSSNPFLAVSDTESAGTHRNCNHPR